MTHSMSHSGMDKLLSRLKLSWYLPRMTPDVGKAIQACEICQMAKKGGLKPAGGQHHLFVGRAWQKLGVDLVGPLPETDLDTGGY